MKQFEIARATGFSESRVSFLETSRVPVITMEMETRLAEGFGMSVELYEFCGLSADERREMDPLTRDRLLRALGQCVVEAADKD